MRVVLQNVAGERLNTFPLKADQKNTLFLYLDQAQATPAALASLLLWVQGPGGIVKEGGVRQRRY